MQKPVEPLGTEDLEAGMRPTHARDFALVAAIACAMLLVLNSEGLVRWTQRLPSSQMSLWVAERAYQWNELMRAVGATQPMERLRLALRRYTPDN